MTQIVIQIILLNVNGLLDVEWNVPPLNDLWCWNSTILNIYVIQNYEPIFMNQCHLNGDFILLKPCTLLKDGVSSKVWICKILNAYIFDFHQLIDALFGEKTSF